MNYQTVQLGTFPSSQRRGGRAMKKMFPFRFGAAGVARSASPIGRSLDRSSAKSSGLNIFAKLLLRLRPIGLALRATPSAALRWLRDFLLMRQPPLLCEEGNMSLELQTPVVGKRTSETGG